jgi:hypothetical protein
MRRLRVRLASLTLGLLAALLGPVSSAEAGCGCEKAPPAPAQIRPAATYAGGEVTLFPPGIAVGSSYQVKFISGTTTNSVAVNAVAVARRDLADRVVRPQLVVPLPALPLGPTRVEVRNAANALLMSLPDRELTVAPNPVPLPALTGTLRMPGYRAAVSRDGDVYLSLDVTGITAARVFRARIEGVPLRFAPQNVVFYNRQGFMMQMLNASMPGLFTLDASSGSDSDWLTYSRHEFDTYFLNHSERSSHALDASDSNWHLDGTPHIDHNKLVVQIAGMNRAPGATPAAALVVETRTLFHHGVFTDVSAKVQASTIDAERLGVPLATGGDIASNGGITISSALVNGNVSAKTVSVSSSTVTGTITVNAAPLALLPVSVPNGLVNLGNLSLGNGQTMTLQPGSYLASGILLDGSAVLTAANAAGPVTIYVTGTVKISGGAKLLVADPNPEKLALYVAGGPSILLDKVGTFYGVIYAPGASLKVKNAEFHGSFVARDALIDTGAWIHYDRSLRGE